MSSEHAIEQVPLAEIHEGDTIQDPKSGNWTTIVGTDSGTTSVIHRYSDGEQTVIEEYRVYYGDQGEKIDSRFVKGPRQSPGEGVIAPVLVPANRLLGILPPCRAVNFA